MSRRTTAIAAALSVLALGSPLMTGCVNPLATNFYNSGVEKYKKGDYQGAIADYDKAIEIYPEFVSAFEERGIAKESLNDLYGACLDWRMAEDLFGSGERDGGGKDSIEWVKKKC